MRYVVFASKYVLIRTEDKLRLALHHGNCALMHQPSETKMLKLRKLFYTYVPVFYHCTQADVYCDFTYFMHKNAMRFLTSERQKTILTHKLFFATAKIKIFKSFYGGNLE